MFAIEQLIQANIPFFLTKKQLINILIGVLVLVAVINKQLFSRVKFKLFLKEEILVFALFMYSLVTVLWSPDPQLGYQQWSKQWPYMIVLLILAPRLITNHYEVTKLFLPHAIVGGIISIMLLTTVEWQGRMVVLGNQGGNPLVTAQMAGYAILAALLHNSKNPKELLFFILKICIAITCAIVAIRSGSRGQLLSTFIALLIFWPLAYKVKNIFGFIFASIIFCSIIYLFTYGLQEYWADSDRFSLDAFNKDAGGRLDASFILLTEWFSHPSTIIFGLGNSASYSLIGFYPHNVFFEVICEEGLIGLSLYILIIYYMFN